MNKKQFTILLVLVSLLVLACGVISPIVSGIPIADQQDAAESFRDIPTVTAQPTAQMLTESGRKTREWKP